jgi:hypothetical protein
VTPKPSPPPRPAGSPLRGLLREPFLHFLLLGAAVFALYRVTSGRSSAEDQILVSVGRQQSLAETFRLIWQRPPTEAELQGLVADYVREELLVREAVRLGLDQDDPVVRRRLRTRMDVFFDDTVPVAPPTDAQLQAYVDAHPDAFRTDERITFTQVYLNPTRHGAQLEETARRLNRKLERALPETDVAALGDRSMLGSQFDAVTERDVTRIFGDDFAKALADAPLERWSGPIRSGYGVHFVKVHKRVRGRPARLEEVREAAQREWLSQETARARESAYQALLRKAKVTIEPGSLQTGAPQVNR